MIWREVFLTSTASLLPNLSLCLVSAFIREAILFPSAPAECLGTNPSLPLRKYNLIFIHHTVYQTTQANWSQLWRILCHEFKKF